MKPPEVRARAVELLVEGRSVASVARELGCAQATVRAWRRAEPGFHQRYHRRRVERFEEALDRALAEARAVGALE